MRPPDKVDFMCGWGAIAAELGVSVSTAQRWHKIRPLPISYVGNKPTTTRVKVQDWAHDPNQGSRTGGRDD